MGSKSSKPRSNTEGLWLMARPTAPCESARPLRSRVKGRPVIKGVEVPTRPTCTNEILNSLNHNHIQREITDLVCIAEIFI